MNQPPVEVWINGVYEGLSKEDHLDHLFLAIDRATGPGTQLVYYRYADVIRIEKSFRGYLRKHQVFEHVLDNLITLEDPQILNGRALIGTATLPDWIMGGQLTSRLYVEKLANGDWKFVRPLYDDDLSTADRHFGLKKGRDDVKIAMITKEVERLRHLATLPHPFVAQPWGEEKKEASPTAMELEGMGLLKKALPTRDDSSVSSSVVFLEDESQSA